MYLLHGKNNSRLLLATALLLVVCTTVFASEEPYRFVLFQHGPSSEFSAQKNKILTSLKSFGLHREYQLLDKDIYSPGWKSTATELAAIAKQIMEREDVDLILSMGTAATKALLAVNNLRTPIIGIDISEPLEAGIIKTPHETGIKNLALRYIPGRWIRVFRIFHQITSFTRIGIIHNDSIDGRSFSNLLDAREAGRDLGFQVVDYAEYDPDQLLESCSTGVDALIQEGIDALYLSEINCFDPELHDISNILHKLHDNHVLTFSSYGEDHVRLGAFMGVSTTELRPLGKFYADMIIKILQQGKLPGEVPITAEFTPEIILNLYAADKLGVDFSIPVLVSADRIFDNAIYATEEGHPVDANNP